MALKIKSISGIEDIVVSFADSANNVPATGIVGLETSGSITAFVKDNKLVLSGKNTDLSDYYDVDEINDFLDEKYYTSAFENVSGTFLTAHQDLSNYYTKNETSGASEISDALDLKEDKVFVAEYNVTPYQEIKAAYDAGKQIICKFYEDKEQWPEFVRLLRLSQYLPMGNSFYFEALTNDTVNIYVICGYYSDDTHWKSTRNKFYKVTETSGSEQLADAFNDKQDNLTFAGENNTITAINSSAIGSSSESNNSWKQWSEDNGSSGDSASIYIGENNTISGHSISLGWNNTTNESNAAHTMLFGYMNNANNDVSAIKSKDITITNLIHYTDAELNSARDAATAAQAVINNYTNQYNVSFYTSAGRNYSDSIKLVDYYYTSDYGLQSEIVFPLQAGFDYSTWSTAYIGSKYYFIPTTKSADIISWHNQQYISDRFFDRVRYVTDSTMTNIKNQLASFWTEEKAIQYQNYLNLSATYTQMVAKNNTYVTATSSIKPETNSIVVGTNNEVNHYNSYIFGAYNKSLTYDSSSANDDGFVYAFGLYNTVARNYDMAIGYGSIASGGENIAIGTPQITNKLAEDTSNGYLNTKAIGYKNIAVRSNVSGIENIAANSIITNSANLPVNTNTDNLFLNAMISGYNNIHSNIIANISPGFKHNYYAGEGYPIHLGTANFSFIQNTLMNNEQGAINNSIVFSDRGYENSDEATIVSAKIYRSLVGFGYSPIKYSQIDTSIFGFNSTADSATNVGASIVVKSKVTDLLAESLIIGSDVGNVAGSVIVTDYPKSSSADGNNIRNTVRSIVIGDNICIGEDINSPNCNSFIIGEKNSAFNNSFNIRIFGRSNSLDADATKNYTDIFGENNVTYTGTYSRVFGNGNMFDGNYNEIFGIYNKIMNKDTSVSNLTDWSQFQNNTTPSRKAKANTTETSAILYTKQSLYNNYVYYYQNVDELNTKWQTVKSYIKNFSIMPSTGMIYYDYGKLYYPNSSASNIINGFVTKAEYQSWISYDSEFYIEDYITYEMYNNLPTTAKSQYTSYGSVSGKSLYYRTIDWKNMARTHVFSAMPVISGDYTTNQGMAYCHFIELETANLTQVTSDADLYNLGTPNNNDIIYTNSTGYVNAKLGVKGVFNAGDVLIADYEEPNVWSKYNQYARPNAANHILIRGTGNSCYNTTEVNHTYLFGTNNELLGGYHSYEFIEGCNNRISGSDNSNLTIIGGANTISGSTNYHTMLVGQNNTATSGILSFAFGTDNYTNSACSYAFGEGLRADYNQIVVGKFNEELPNDLYYRFRYKWNSNTQSAEPVPTSGVIFVIGNGYLDNCYEYGVGRDWKIKDLNGNVVGTQILNDTYLKRSNAMTVSANGVVSAADYITSAGKKLSDCITTLPEITEYVAGTGIVFTAGAGANEGKTVIEVDSTNYKLLTTAEYAELTAAVAIISANSARWVLTPAS